MEGVTPPHTHTCLPEFTFSDNSTINSINRQFTVLRVCEKRWRKAFFFMSMRLQVSNFDFYILFELFQIGLFIRCIYLDNWTRVVFTGCQINFLLLSRYLVTTDVDIFNNNWTIVMYLTWLEWLAWWRRPGGIYKYNPKKLNYFTNKKLLKSCNRYFFINTFHWNKIFVSEFQNLITL